VRGETLDGLSPSIITSQATPGATGSAGSVLVNARRIEVLDGGSIDSSTFGSGNGGSVVLTADSILLAGAGTTFTSTIGAASVGATGGTGGNVEITSRELVLLGGGQIQTTTFGSGNAGSLVLRIGESLAIDGESPGGFARSGVFGQTLSSGAAGNIDVSAGRVSISGGGAIASSSHGSGPGGSVIINAGTIDIAGVAPSDGTPSGIYARATQSADGGSISVTASSLTLRDGAIINAEALGGGNAGYITIDAGSTLKMTGGSAITTAASSGDGGNIDIKAIDFVHLVDSRITTAVGTGQGDGGNITIDPVFVILQNSQIIANAFGGSGGNISIVSQFFLQDTQSLVQASSQFGVSGTVVISAPQVDLSSSVAVLPSAFFDASGLLRESCAARAGRSNSFVPAGRGGLAAQPERAGFSDYASASAPLSEFPPLWLARSGCPG